MKLFALLTSNAVLVVTVLSGCGGEPGIASSNEKTLRPSVQEVPAARAPASVTNTTADHRDYSLSVDATVLDASRVRLSVTTSIPGTVEIMAGIALAGQAPNDIFIGTNARVTLQDGTGDIVLDTSTLPTGRYEAEASFYPRWGLKDRRAKDSGANIEIEARAPLTLTGSGESAQDVARRKEGQRWVMENVISGRTWDPNEWLRFGAFEPVTVTRYNPRVIKGYYFSTIDMTVFVNSLKGEVSVWRLGRASH